jgi:hypothetical protein
LDFAKFDINDFSSLDFGGWLVGLLKLMHQLANFGDLLFQCFIVGIIVGVSMGAFFKVVLNLSSPKL